MKKLLFILILGALAYFTKAQSIDTVGSCIIFKNEKNTEFIIPKTSVLLHINPASSDLIVLSTTGNKDVFSGKLSTLTVPGAASNPAKLAFLKKQLSTSLGGMGGSSSDTKQAKQDVQIANQLRQLDSVQVTNALLRDIKNKPSAGFWKGDSIATYQQKVVVAKENKQDVEISLLSSIDSKLNWSHNRLGQDIESFETITAGATGTIETKMLGSFSIENIGTSNGIITFQNGDILTLKPDETFFFKGYEFAESKQFLMCFDVNFDAQNSNFRIIKTFARN